MVVEGDIAKEEFGAVGLAIDLENLEGAFQHGGEPFGAALLKAFLERAIHLVAVAAECAEEEKRLLGREGLGWRTDGVTGGIDGEQEAVAEGIDLGLLFRKARAAQEKDGSTLSRPR